MKKLLFTLTLFLSAAAFALPATSNVLISTATSTSANGDFVLFAFLENGNVSVYRHEGTGAAEFVMTVPQNVVTSIIEWHRTNEWSKTAPTLQKLANGPCSFLLGMLPAIPLEHFVRAHFGLPQTDMALSGLGVGAVIGWGAGQIAYRKLPTWPGFRTAYAAAAFAQAYDQQDYASSAKIVTPLSTEQFLRGIQRLTAKLQK